MIAEKKLAVEVLIKEGKLFIISMN